jgi:hypothetical protein
MNFKIKKKFMVKIKVFKSYNEISNMKSAKFSNDQSSIFDTGASKSGTSDSKILTNLEKCEKVTVQGAFGPPCIPSLKGKLGPLELETLVIPGMNDEPATLELSEAEIADVLFRRAGKPAASGYNPDKNSIEMEKIIPRKETKTFDLKVLNKDKFSMTSVLNKQRFEQLDRLLRSNDLYTLATKTRPPPISTPSNEFGYVPSMVKCINGRNKTIPADSIANYDYDLTRLETVMHIAFQSTSPSVARIRGS